MLADLIRSHGWEVSDLGADTPDASFVHAALDEPDLVAVAVSVSATESLGSARSVLAALRAALPDVLLVVGGGAVRDEAQAKDLGADAFAASGRDFADLLDRADSGQDDAAWGSAAGH